MHLVYDIRELYGLADFAYPAIFSFVMQWGSVLFLLISGICVTLGPSPGAAGAGSLWVWDAVQPGDGGDVLAGLPGPGDHHLVWHSPLPGGMHASGGRGLGRLPNWVLGALALLFGSWAIGSGALRWPPPGSFPWA